MLTALLLTHHNHSTRLPKIPTTTYVYIFITIATAIDKPLPPRRDDIVTSNFHLFATMPHYNIFAANTTAYSYFSATTATATYSALTAASSDALPGVGLRVRVVGLGSEDPEFKSHSAVALIPGGVDSACHPSKVGK